jgi:FtsP/CotA-like multicopper oxidase with cupredoxin domain
MTAVRQLSRIACAVFIVLIVAASPPAAALALPFASFPRVRPNDNRAPAGTLDHRELTLALRAAAGRWYPEGPTGPGLEVEAFGEVGQPLVVPAPLIRVVEGTAIFVSIRNDLAATLTVHGLCTRDGSPCAAVDVPPGEVRAVRFASGPAGTYHYWASTVGAPIPFRELAGAFVVDPSADRVEPDRIMVITEWSDLTVRQLREIVTADDPTETFVSFRPRVTFVINGLSWPATERLTYDMGEKVRWRVINLSSQAHPFHLHGFYFEIESLGNGLRDTPIEESRRRRVVTQLLASGGTMVMTWIPERAGNWLFHCHIMHHVSVNRRVGDTESPGHHGVNTHEHTNGDDASAGMAGMVIGVIVRDRRPAPAVQSQVAAASPRTLSLIIDRKADGKPGPPLVLRRNEPVEITLMNRLDEPTAIHWHGMELDSYYDGVHGWSGSHQRVTPIIEPGGSFVVRFTPPRAGTFIYHTHLHDYRQLSSGLYGPLIVTDAGETFDPVTDHVILIGRSGLTSEEPSLLTEAESVVVNGERAPKLVWKAGIRHRLRLINITPDDIFSVALVTAEGSVMWKPVAKDGASLPEAESVAVPARQIIAVGETYDFEYQAPPGRHSLWINVRTPGGKWAVQGRIVVK